MYVTVAKPFANVRITATNVFFLVNIFFYLFIFIFFVIISYTSINSYTISPILTILTIVRCRGIHRVLATAISEDVFSLIEILL